MDFSQLSTNSNCQTSLAELDEDDARDVQGGMSLQEGGINLIMLGVGSMALAPAAATFALAAGVTMVGGAFYGRLRYHR